MVCSFCLTHTHTDTERQARRHMYAHTTHTNTHIRYVHIHTHTHAHMYVHTYAHIHTRTHTQAHIHTNTHNRATIIRCKKNYCDMLSLPVNLLERSIQWPVHVQNPSLASYQAHKLILTFNNSQKRQRSSQCFSRHSQPHALITMMT